MDQLAKVGSSSELRVNAMEELQVMQRPYIQALMTDKIKDIEPQKCDEQIYLLLKIAESDSGLTKMHNDDLVILANSVREIIKSNYKGLTIGELKIACKQGVIKSYGEWFGLCLKSVCQWIEGYLDYEERVMAIQSYNKLIEGPETAKKPQIFTKEKFDQCAKDAYQDYLLKEKMPVYPTIVYDCTKSLLTLETLISPDDWPKIKAEALIDYKEKIKPLDKSLTAEWKLDPLVNTVYGSSIKKIALKCFYESLIKQGKTEI